MAKVKIKNLNKNFGNTKILSDINLEINDGEFFVLVGPSGSGKSTILRTIAGLESPTSGEIEIDDLVINNLLPKERDIAMVFQNYALYPHLTIDENLAFPLKMKKQDKETIQKSVSETAKLLGLEKHLKKKPKELSGGERQRVALGRAIIRQPKLFLMDEPLSNLDAKLRTQMRAELLKLHKALLTTVVYVTHDQIEALTMGSTIVVLNKGKIQQIGTPQEIYNKPVNTFVGGFVGNPAMNFFNFKIIDNSTILFLGETFNINKSLNLLKLKELFNQDIIMGIRPDNISIKEKCDLTFPAQIELIEMLGNEYLIYAFSKTNKVNFSIKISDKSNVSLNNQVEASIDLNKAHFFNPKTGERINI